MKRITGHPHKIVVCGTRTYTDKKTIYQVLDQLLEGLKIASLISGGCRGVDEIVKQYATDRGLIFCEVKPQWTLFGKGAPLKRNTQMAELGTSTIGFWDGKSTGTFDMLKKAKDAKHEYISYYNTKTRYIETL